MFQNYDLKNNTLKYKHADFLVNYRVATLSTFYLTVSGIILPSIDYRVALLSTRCQTTKGVISEDWTILTCHFKIFSLRTDGPTLIIDGFAFTNNNSVYWLLSHTCKPHTCYTKNVLKKIWFYTYINRDGMLVIQILNTYYILIFVLISCSKKAWRIEFCKKTKQGWQHS